MSCLNLPLVVQESALTSGFWGDGEGGGGGGGWVLFTMLSGLQVYT